jgi:hypothetical protein
MRRSFSVLGVTVAALLSLVFVTPVVALAAAGAANGTAPLAQKIAATPQVQGKSGVSGNSYKSPVWGYSFKWDSSVWSVPKDGEVSQPDKKYTQLELDANTGSLIISGFVADNGDAKHCVAAEYNVNSGDPQTAKWTVAKGSDGKELKGGNSTKYYTVYTFDYTSSNTGKTTQLAAYFECRALVKGSAVLVIDAFSPVNAYNDHVDNVNTVLKTIKIPSSAGVATPVASPIASPAATPVSKGTTKTTTSKKTGIKGNTFTSPGFDFSMHWSNAWKVKDESIKSGNEQLVLSNGTSTVRVWATTAYKGNLPGCVDYAVTQDAKSSKYADMKLATTSSGDPFQGADSTSAYSVFLYKGAKGVTYAHFIECRYIAKGKSVLIFTQDVPNSKWVDQRQVRRELQQSIKLPKS